MADQYYGESELATWNAKQHAASLTRDNEKLREALRAAGEPASIVKALEALTDEQRLSVFADFCRNCGSTDPTCQCWNDE